MEIETLDEILIIQGGTLHGGTCQLHRIHIGHRRDGSSAPHLISHLIQTGADTFGLELIGNGPTRTLSSESECALLAQRIDFQDDAVGSNGQVLTLCIPIVDEVVYLL